jgi:hypothetical protein
MRLLYLTVFGFLLLAAGLGSEAAGQVDKAKAKDKGKTAAATAAVLTDPLLPTDLVAKLKLTAAQQTEVAKLFKEFDAKLKEIASKAQAEPAPVPKVKTKDKTGSTALSPAISAAFELRGNYDAKFEAFLTDAQKKVLEDYRVKLGEAALTPGKK